MAGVLDALASYVTNMLADMAKEEVAMLIGVSGEIDTLAVKLGDLKNFLADADRRSITDRSVRAWLEELKRAMYLATDIIDLCQLKAMEKRPSNDMGCLNPLFFCMRDPLHTHDIGIRIKALNQKLDDICTRNCNSSFIEMEAYQAREMTRSLYPGHKTDPLMERSDTVGEKIEEDTRALVQLLTKEAGHKSANIMVVAIVGVGGIGKTTLSKKVFNDEAMQAKFSKKIWLSITQEFSEVELLRTAISAVDGYRPGPEGMSQDKAVLVMALVSAIKGKKFFLVLDDMWGVDEWNKLLMAPFSHGAHGSRVLVTTRHKNVARGMKAMEPYHHVNKLGPEDAWSLLKKQVLTLESDELEVDILKDIGLKIIAKCDGLPLAVKVMGGLLCQKRKTRRDWEVLLDDISSASMPMPMDLNYTIYLSYEELHSCLKQCFLHFSLKPKNTILTVNQVVSMWIGEGLVYGDPFSLEEEGKGYYKELILRNLIEPDTRFPGQLVCNMHDVILSFAQFVAKDEALVAKDGDTIRNKLISHDLLRLSIETKGVESYGFEWRYLTEQKSLRTLILSGKFQIQSGDSLITFSRLRSLHIESTNCAALVESVCQLKHLRYLSLSNCTDISRLPDNIQQMKFLQHIGLDGCESIGKLPDSIVKLRELRYLDINDTHVNSIPRGFCALTNLRVLCGFPTYMDGDWCSLEALGPLSQLRELGLKGIETVSATSSIAKARVGAKLHLTMLTLKCSSRLGDDGLLKGGVSEEEEQRIEVVFDVLCPRPCLEYLVIKGYFGRQLPRWMMCTAIAPLENLRTLWMEDLACCTQLPDGLCQLPYLEYLGVFHAPAIKRVGPEFVQSWYLPFPRLHNMTLNRMVEWEEWEWEEGVQAMSALEELCIQSCKLRCIPPDLAFYARSLKKLTISNVQRLDSLENFASVVELYMLHNPDLRRLSNFPKLQNLQISCCQKLESLQEMTALQRLALDLHFREKQLPIYLQTVKPSCLLLKCSTEILTSMALGKSGCEWYKLSHIQQVEAHEKDGDDERKCYVLYTSEPYSIETNIQLDYQNLPDEILLYGLSGFFQPPETHIHCTAEDGQLLQNIPDETLLSGLAGVFQPPETHLHCTAEDGQLLQNIPDETLLSGLAGVFQPPETHLHCTSEDGQLLQNIPDETLLSGLAGVFQPPETHLHCTAQDGQLLQGTCCGRDHQASIIPDVLDLECLLLDETTNPKALPLSLLKGITCNFSHQHEIGRGGFAVVYKGIINYGSMVAVKRLSNTYMHEKEFHREVECLMKVKHNNIVRFLGYCMDTQGCADTFNGKFVMADVQERLLCFEYLPNGSLDKHIKDASSGLVWSKCYKIIRGICEGLRYLHEKNIIHLDLKPPNILMDTNMVPKITDFGLSRCFEEEQTRAIATKMGGTLGYLAPEFASCIITHKFDLYSLGVIIMEIVTGEKGYQPVETVLESWTNRVDKLQEGLQFEQIRVCVGIARECIEYNPEKRPASIHHIIARLD